MQNDTIAQIRKDIFVFLVEFTFFSAIAMVDRFSPRFKFHRAGLKPRPMIESRFSRVSFVLVWGSRAARLLSTSDDHFADLFGVFIVIPL